MSCKVSIIITAHNYAKYLPRALDSVLSQSYPYFEVVVVNDGSTDHTEEVLHAYRDDEQIKFLQLSGVGLASACNEGIRASTGEYIVRLDADDYFDENLLLVEATYLDQHPNVGMVFCDYYVVDMYGEIQDRVKRAKVSDEVELLDRPSLAAGAMYRRKCYDVVGGYNENIRYQEDYDFWIKFIEKYEVRNISLPLMFYRQHGASMSRNFEARMQTRREVKKKFVDEHRDADHKIVLAVVPARSDMVNGQKYLMQTLNGEETLLSLAISKLLSIDVIDRVIVSTEDAEISQAAQEEGAEVPFLRSHASIDSTVPFEQVMLDLLSWLEREEGYTPDIVVIHHPHSPLIMAAHIEEAIDTIMLYKANSVIAVVEDLTYHWTPGRHGLTPVGYRKRVVRQDKDLVYKEAGGLYVFDAPGFRASGELLGKQIGHIELAPHEALRVNSAFTYWLAESLIEQGKPWLKS